MKVGACTRSFSMHIRQQSYGQSVARMQSNSKVAKGFNCMWIQDVIQVMLVEFATATLRVGTDIAHWTEGMTQGSCLANGVAIIVGVYLERKAYSIREVGQGWFTRALIQRFVDDIFILVNLYFAKAMDEDDMRSILGRMHARIAGQYEGYFKI